MKHYVGLDISMKETFICIIDEMGEIISQGKTKTDPDQIHAYLEKFAVSYHKIGLESGSLSYWLLKELKERKLPAFCIDARQMATLLSVQINKTDKNDARGIAQAMRSGLYREVAEKSQKSLEISTLMSARRLLVEEKVKISNSIRGFLKTYGIRLGSVGDAAFAQKVLESLGDGHKLAREGIESLLRAFENAREEIKRLTKKIELLAKEDKVVQRFMTIPGVGAITALAYRIEIDNPHRFAKSRSVGAYLGMTPRQYSSGETMKQGRISKCGSSEMRRLLNEAALVMMTRSSKWSRVRVWGLKVQRKHGMRKACMAVGRKLAVIMHRMWMDDRDFVFGESKEEKLIAKAA